MKRIIFAVLIMLAFASVGKAQIYIPPGFIFGTPTAGAACTAGSGQVNATTGIAYLCQNSVWVALAPSGTVASTVFKLTAPVSNIGGALGSVSAVSGGGGFSGTGTIFLTNFNTCTGSTATVNLVAGAYSSTILTGAGSGCTGAPTTATCTSGTATCTGSPVTITVTTSLTAVVIISNARVPGGTMSATGKLVINIWVEACAGSATPQPGCGAINTGTCTLRAYFSTTSGAITTAFSGTAAASAHNGLRLESSVRNQNSLAAQQVDTMVSPSAAVSTTQQILPTTFNTANDLYVNVSMQNSVLTDTCFISQMDIVNWP